MGCLIVTDACVQTNIKDAGLDRCNMILHSHDRLSALPLY